jgi:hypothetical protein
MEIQGIKRLYVILTLACLSMVFFTCFSQSTSKSLIDFKIINSKKNYHLTDNVVLSVNNTSSKPLYYIIGKEFYDSKYKKWIEFNMDIKNDPSLDVAGRYEVIPAAKVNLITVSLLKTSGKPGSKHGVSSQERFYLRYHNLNSIINDIDPKLVSEKFVEVW